MGPGFFDNRQVFRKQLEENTRADWLKIVFLLLDGDTELHDLLT